MKKKLPAPGFEPQTPRIVGRYANHYTTGLQWEKKLFQKKINSDIRVDVIFFTPIHKVKPTYHNIEFD